MPYRRTKSSGWPSRTIIASASTGLQLQNRFPTGVPSNVGGGTNLLQPEVHRRCSFALPDGPVHAHASRESRAICRRIPTCSCSPYGEISTPECSSQATSLHAGGLTHPLMYEFWAIKHHILLATLHASFVSTMVGAIRTMV